MSQPASLGFSRDSKAGRGVQKLCEDCSESLRYSPIGGCGPEEAAAGQLGQGILYDSLTDYIWLSPVGWKLELGGKVREAVSD